MMTYMQVMGVQIISVTIAVAIMTTFNPWIILIIVVLSFAQFLFKRVLLSSKARQKESRPRSRTGKSLLPTA